MHIAAAQLFQSASGADIGAAIVTRPSLKREVFALIPYNIWFRYKNDLSYQSYIKYNMIYIGIYDSIQNNFVEMWGLTRL